MADQLPLEDVKQVSHSFAFQRMLKLNPQLAKQAERDRDKMALEFRQAQLLDHGSPAYAASMLEGEYDPTLPPVDIHIGELG